MQLGLGVEEDGLEGTELLHHVSNNHPPPLVLRSKCLLILLGPLIIPLPLNNGTCRRVDIGTWCLKVIRFSKVVSLNATTLITGTATLIFQ